jgi:hypothetical protein
MALALRNEPGAEVVVCASGVPVGPGNGNPSSSRISMAVASSRFLSSAFRSSNCLCKEGFL